VNLSVRNFVPINIYIYEKTLRTRSISPAIGPDPRQGPRPVQVVLSREDKVLSEQEKIRLITQISLDINEVKDLDILLEKILRNVRRVFNADAGSIYLKRGDTLRFSHSQNDTLQKRLGPDRKLIYNTFSIPIDHHSISGFVAKNRSIVNIPDAYNMDGSQPYTFDAHFDELTDYRTQSMLAVPMINQQGDVLGVMQIINAKDAQGNIVSFSKSDEMLIKHFATSAALAIERAQMTRDLILRMISMAELRDPEETSDHVNRVAAYSVEIYEGWAKKHGIGKEQFGRKSDILRMAAMLHDVGKVAVSDVILKKQGKLTPEEFEIIKSHTYYGAKLFVGKHSDFDSIAAEVALNHHERWDGKGYPGHIDPVTGKPIPGFEGPNGRPLPKKGKEIPLFGRIVAIADVFDALSSTRCYKEAWDEDKILAEMEKETGAHFDPELMEIFFSRLDTIRSLSKRYSGDRSPTSQNPQLASPLLS